MPKQSGIRILSAVLIKSAESPLFRFICFKETRDMGFATFADDCSWMVVVENVFTIVFGINTKAWRYCRT